MKIRYSLSLIVSLLFALNTANGQSIERKGHLVKAPLNGSQFQDVAPEADMQYNTGISVLDEYYTAVLNVGGESYYLFKHEFDPPPEWEWFNNYNLSVSGALKPDSALGTIYSYNRPATDIISPYLSEEPNIVTANGGLWIMSGYLGYAFLAGDGSLYEYNHHTYSSYDSTLGMRLQNFIGKVNGCYLGAFEEIDSESEIPYEYYLVDVDQSPYLDSLTAKRVYFSNDAISRYIPTNIFHLKDDFYLDIDEGFQASILEMKDSVFSISKEYDYEVSRNAAFRNNKLYVKRDYSNSLLSLSYNPEANELDAPVVLINSQDYDAVQFDQNLRYGALVKDDSVYIYDVDNEAVINSIAITGAKGILHPFIDSEYVYVHIVTDVVANEDEPNIASSYKLSAYPNPFNPATTITFSIGKAGVVELNVYDILGRKVTSLLNEYRAAGSYEVKFNGANLPSGVYLYTLKAGSYARTGKLMLIK